MSESPEFSIAYDELYAFVGFNNNELSHLKPYEDLTFKALLDLYEISYETENIETPLTSADLLIPSKRYHIGLNKTMKSIFENSIRTIGLALILNSLNLHTLPFVITVASLHNLLKNITKLTPEQIKVINAILTIKKEKSLPNYSPKTVEVVKVIGDKYNRRALIDTVSPILNKVVKFKNERWEVIF